MEAQLHKEKYDIVLKVYETIKPVFDEIAYLLDNAFKYCRD